MIRPPRFWQTPHHIASTLLQPAACVWDSVGRIKRHYANSRKTPIPSLCIGNVTIGGAGKTPTIIYIAAMLKASGANPAIATRGYGAPIGTGVTRVDLRLHSAKDVGDEAVLLARSAPCYVSRDRFSASVAANADGATHILFDDGLQNPAIAYDRAFVIVDGGYGFGNGRIIPAGPLREDPAAALARCQAMLIIGTDVHHCAARAQPDLPVLTAELVPELPPDFPRTKSFLAFAGIGRPEKFFQSCRTAGLSLAATKEFPDHHPYSIATLTALARQAKQLNAQLLTTAKDAVRLPPEWREQITIFPVTVRCSDPDALRQLLPR